MNSHLYYFNNIYTIIIILIIINTKIIKRAFPKQPNNFQLILFKHEENFYNSFSILLQTFIKMSNIKFLNFQFIFVHFSYFYIFQFTNFQFTLINSINLNKKTIYNNFFAQFFARQLRPNSYVNTYDLLSASYPGWGSRSASSSQRRSATFPKGSTTAHCRLSAATPTFDGYSIVSAFK